jgi:inosose dehydratase
MAIARMASQMPMRFLAPAACWMVAGTPVRYHNRPALRATMSGDILSASPRVRREKRGESAMQNGLDRRTLLKTIGRSAACLAAPAIGGAAARRLKIGHTSITWGFKPEDAEAGILDSAALGYHGYESLGQSLQALEPSGGIGRFLDRHKMPLPSTYFTVNLSDPARRQESVDNVIRWGKILKKYGGHTAVLGPNGVKRPAFDFKASKRDIVAALNEIGTALADLGLAAAVHQHTETCIETRDEVYSVMESVDTRVVKFGPDVGQLAKSGSDPVKILRDFLPLIRNIHLKDYLGSPHWAGYCPLGQGKVDIAAVMDVLEQARDLEYVMVELDPSPNPPMPAFETARTTRDHLKKLGYTFRS